MPRFLSWLPSCWPQKVSQLYSSSELPLHAPFWEFLFLKIGSRVKCSFLNAPSPSRLLCFLWRQEGDTQFKECQCQRPLQAASSVDEATRLPADWSAWTLLAVQGAEQTSLRRCRFCWFRRTSPLQEAGNSSKWDLEAVIQTPEQLSATDDVPRCRACHPEADPSLPAAFHPGANISCRISS